MRRLIVVAAALDSFCPAPFPVADSIRYAVGQ